MVYNIYMINRENPITIIAGNHELTNTQYIFYNDYDNDKVTIAAIERDKILAVTFTPLISIYQ